MRVKYSIIGNRVELFLGVEHKGKIISTANDLLICIVQPEGIACVMENVFRRYKNVLQIDGEGIDLYGE